ncbi:kinase-like domain-containing protein [Penicillium herquei]|nr:kinase-like domain-containing protein [Penicillium herquei]
MDPPHSDENHEPEASSKPSLSSVKNLLQTPGKLGTTLWALEYDPGFPKIEQNLARVKPGVVMKYPHYPWWLINVEQLEKDWDVEQVQTAKEKFEEEKLVFEILGEHPRIVRCLRIAEVHRGFLLEEASNGDLHGYMENHGAEMNMSLRLKWRSQAAEAIEFIHKHDVHHFDMGPRNMLISTFYCAIGFAGMGDENHTCGPTPGFFDPEWTISPVNQDLFGLASIFYLIMTGSCPYADVMRNDTVEEWNAVLHMIRWDRKFPSVDNILGGSVILKAWTRVYSDATSLINDLRLSDSNHPQACVQTSGEPPSTPPPNW